MAFRYLVFAHEAIWHLIDMLDKVPKKHPDRMAFLSRVSEAFFIREVEDTERYLDQQAKKHGYIRSAD